MDKNADDDTQYVASEVLEYLMNYPNAADSLEGITTWWLGRQRYESALNTVQNALDMLVADNKVVKSQASGDRIIYSLRFTNDD